MRAAVVVPTGQERRFGENEIIVSKTDLKGVISYANDVFVRVSGYQPGELAGQPHSIIRHPEMPGGIFRLLWETIAGGQEIFAYVNNLARDGAHYWVLAHVTPSFGADGSITGYHSNRRLPEPAAIRQVQPLYQRMLTEEKRHSRAVEAAQASLSLLSAELDEAGLSYEEFVWKIITDGAGAGSSWAA